MMHDFEARRTEMQRSHRRMNRIVNAMFVIVPILMVATVTTTVVVAYQAGCLRSMILNHVCLSDPAIDGVLKNIFGK